MNVKFSTRAFLYWLFLLSIPIVLAVSVRIVFTTQINRHPDEILHLDAIRYFAEHWWMPPLNVEGLIYGPDGWSRVQNGEAVYWLYGRFFAGLRAGAGLIDGLFHSSLSDGLHLPNNPIARLCNTLLYGVTLLILAWKARTNYFALTMGLLLVSIPQLIYLYSYANSDAWGVSWVIFAALFFLRPWPFIFHWRDSILLGLILSMIALSKQPFWLSIPFLMALVYVRWRHRSGAKQARSALVTRAALVVGVVCVLVLPVKVWYPLSQGDYETLSIATRDQRAWPGFGPSNPTEGSRQWRDKGIPFTTVVQDGVWYEKTAQSFYGNFGYLILPVPWWQYAIASVALSYGVLTTLFCVTRGYAENRHDSAILLLGGIVTLLGALAASLYHSWIVDIQAQGRYLFGGIPALAALVGGLIEREPAWMATSKLIVWAILIILAIGSIALIVPYNPLLQ